MSFLHHARELANDLLSPIGISIERTERSPWKWLRSVRNTRIGQFTIEIPTRNPVCWQYDRHPELVRQLGRLTSLLKKKYPNLRALDVGANVGDTACIIKSGEDIPLVCIEGDESTFIFLQKNIAQFRDTTAHKIFLGETTSVASVAVEKAGWNLTLKPVADASGNPINLTRLDDFMAVQPYRQEFKLLKIDTEGFDCQIIRGAFDFIREVRPVITFEYNRGNMDAIGEPGLPTLLKLQEFGYSGVSFHDQGGRLLLATTLANRALIQDLHEYADCVRGRIGYLDLVVFHEEDADAADAFVRAERSSRAGCAQ